jgi:hypothetical protein
VAIRDHAAYSPVGARAITSTACQCRYLRRLLILSRQPGQYMHVVNKWCFPSRDSAVSEIGTQPIRNFCLLSRHPKRLIFSSSDSLPARNPATAALCSLHSASWVYDSTEAAQLKVAIDTRRSAADGRKTVPLALDTSAAFDSFI